MIDLESIYKKVAFISPLLRTGKHLEANEIIVSLIDEFNPITPLISQSQLKELQLILTHMASSQERKDWLAMADYLEYELVDFLENVNQTN